ncbi:MAG: hydroxymethylbilane synthase [Hyphomonadaceae bacterium]|nr:hydroxymethylbilane synthase [Hyphomonadaceae bacterium]
MTRILRIGARASPLAMTQARRVQARLGAALRLEPADHDHRLPLHPAVTAGDAAGDGPFAEAGGKGLFTRALDEALLAGRIDLAVHSLKDAPTRLPAGVVMACIAERGDARDAFIAREARTLADLPPGAVLGTASVRRRAQALHVRPDLKVTPLRGHVGTRLARLEAGAVDAMVLALAGLERLDLAGCARSFLDPVLAPPAAGQGAIGVTARRDDAEIRSLLATLEDPCAAIETGAERAFLAALDGSCRTPVAAYARLDDAGLTFIGETLTPDGRRRWRREAALAPSAQMAADAVALGDQLGRSIRAEAGDQLMWDA